MAKCTTESSLGMSVSPTDVRLITGPQDPYKWVWKTIPLPEKMYLFKKQISKHCIRAYKEIYEGVDKAFVAIPIDASNNDTCASTEILEAPPENTPGPAGSFTAKIDELMTQNLILMTELEQWRSAASNAESSNRELAASLEVARLSANALQQEIEQLKETCRRNTRAANFFRAKAMQSEAIMKEIFSATEAAKAKIPVIYSNS
jgi:hypothetical protein